jgi:4-azaleucine resistance transporter AzlC
LIEKSSSRADMIQGLRDLAPALIAGLPIGLLFGAIANAKGLSVFETALMSALVFAGGAQFTVVEMWAQPLPILTILLSTLLINARHILMSTSIVPKMQHMTPFQRALGLFVMADENWALSERRALHQPLTFAYYGTMGGLFWTGWVAWSTLGAYLGSFMGDPARFGADFAFTAIFIGLIAGFYKGRTTLLVLAASGGASALTYLAIGKPWHVAAGALAGITAAYAIGEADDEPLKTDPLPGVPS